MYKTELVGLSAQDFRKNPSNSSFCSPVFEVSLEFQSETPDSRKGNHAG